MKNEIEIIEKELDEIIASIDATDKDFKYLTNTEERQGFRELSYKAVYEILYRDMIISAKKDLLERAAAIKRILDRIENQYPHINFEDFKK